MGVGVGVAVGAVPSWAQADAMIAATMTITRIRIKLFRVISLTPESGLTCLRDSAIGLSPNPPKDRNGRREDSGRG